jgi:aminoglycoside/choline kinase family phosphotransferase
MKTDLLLRQTRIHFPRFDETDIEISAIEKGGSDRKFYRVRCSPDQTLILVKYNTEREENRHYVEIARFLDENSIRAPKIYFHDAEEGLIWIEDMGERDLHSYRDEGWLVRRAFYESALDEVAKLHQLPAEKIASISHSLPTEFTAVLYRWEQQYFFENCLGRYFKFGSSELATLGDLPALTDIAQRLEDLPRHLVHRDFQSQNIIIRNGQACLIDFQGMRPGLPQYDLASLLYDPYVVLSEAERSELLGYYRHDCGGDHGENFDEVLKLCGMQRLMQALGAYGFLGLVKGQTAFLSHIPAAINSLRAVMKDIPGVDRLRTVLHNLPEAIA